MTIYRIHLHNHKGEYTTEFYRNKQKAYERFNELYQKEQQQTGRQPDDCEEEEEKENTLKSCSWFDWPYNDYSTYISLDKCSLDDIFSD